MQIEQAWSWSKFENRQILVNLCLSQNLQLVQKRDQEIKP